MISLLYMPVSACIPCSRALVIYQRCIMYVQKRSVSNKAQPSRKSNRLPFIHTLFVLLKMFDPCLVVQDMYWRSKPLAIFAMRSLFACRATPHFSTGTVLGTSALVRASVELIVASVGGERVSTAVELDRCAIHG